jgi:hypothetical protein
VGVGVGVGGRERESVCVCVCMCPVRIVWNTFDLPLSCVLLIIHSPCSDEERAERGHSSSSSSKKGTLGRLRKGITRRSDGGSASSGYGSVSSRHRYMIVLVDLLVGVVRGWSCVVGFL